MNRREFLTSHRRHTRSRPSGAYKSTAAPDPVEFSEPPSLEPYAGPWNRTTAAHLLRRTVLAPTYEELRLAASGTMEEIVDALLSSEAFEPPPPRYIGEWLDDPEHYYESGRQDINRALADELTRWWCDLMINSGVSVRERMTLFWHNHFPCEMIFITHDGRLHYLQNQLFRKYAIGNFKKLVHDVTIDKSMLWFLNGRENKKGKEINENYARELQELFTIGITDNDGNPNYTQMDVYEAARTLTGWGWWGPGMTGDVTCPPWYGHDPTDKIVYGSTIRGEEHGERELDRLLDIIFEREQTARYIIRKLYRFFVYTNAPLTPVFPLPEEIETNIIAPLAREFRAGNWNISVVLRGLFTSRHFYDPQIIGASIKSPIDLMVGAARALSTGSTTGEPARHLLQALHANSGKLGQTLFFPPGVQGWQFHRSWISSTTLPQRRSLTDLLIDGVDVEYREVPPGNLDGIPAPVNGEAHLDVISYARQFPSFDNPLQLVADIAEHLLAYPASPRLLAQLTDALLLGQPAYEWAELSDDLKETRLKGMVKFLMRSANFQLM